METLRSLRPALPGIVDLGGLLPRSQRDFLDRFAPMSYLLSAGPPAAEVERLTALLEASVVEVPGPSARFSRGKRPGSFVVGSAAVPGSGRLARTLVEARPRRRPGRSAGYGLIIPACIQSVSSRPVQPRWV